MDADGNDAGPVCLANVSCDEEDDNDDDEETFQRTDIRT